MEQVKTVKKKNEKAKKTSSSGIYQIRYHDGSCLVLLGK